MVACIKYFISMHAYSSHSVFSHSVFSALLILSKKYNSACPSVHAGLIPGWANAGLAEPGLGFTRG